MRVFIVIDRDHSVAGVYTCAVDAHLRWKALADGAVLWESHLNADAATRVATHVSQWQSLSAPPSAP